jgi:hypothetical protein
MRILYSAGNRLGSDAQMSRIVDHLSLEHQIRIAAFNNFSQTRQIIDWTLDALYYKKAVYRQTNYSNVKIFLKDVERFGPDLIISDCEEMSAKIATVLGIKLWYCSPLLLYSGTVWGKFDKKYSHEFIMLSKYLRLLPKAEKYFIYSPFCEVKFGPQIKPGFEWIRPYYIDATDSTPNTYDNICILHDNQRISILAPILDRAYPKISMVSRKCDLEKYKSLLCGSSKVLLAGETSYLSDVMYNWKNVCIFPSFSDKESLLNALIISEYKIGVNLGQIELIGPLIFDTLQEAISTPMNRLYMQKQNLKYLHQHIFV